MKVKNIIRYFLILLNITISYQINTDDLKVISDYLVGFTNYLSNEPLEYEISPNCATVDGRYYKYYGYLVTKSFIKESFIADLKNTSKIGLHLLNSGDSFQQLVPFFIDYDGNFQVTWPGVCVTGILLPSQEMLKENRIPTEKPYFFLPLKDMYLNIRSTDYNDVTGFDYGLNCVGQKYIEKTNNEKWHYLVGNTKILRKCFNGNYNAPGIWSQCEAKFISGLKYDDEEILNETKNTLPLYKNIFHCDNTLLSNKLINKVCDIALRKVWGLIESFNWICDRIDDILMADIALEQNNKFKKFAENKNYKSDIDNDDTKQIIIKSH